MKDKIDSGKMTWKDIAQIKWENKRKNCPAFHSASEYDYCLATGKKCTYKSCIFNYWFQEE